MEGILISMNEAVEKLLYAGPIAIVVLLSYIAAQLWFGKRTHRITALLALAASAFLVLAGVPFILVFTMIVLRVLRIN